MQSCAQQTEKKTTNSKPDYSGVDYSAKSNIIKNPEKLTGDEKVIFYHPYFLKLSHEEAKSLEPLKIKEEFAKIGILTSNKERFQEAYLFFRSDNTAHKKSCENWIYFKDLAPKSKN